MARSKCMKTEKIRRLLGLGARARTVTIGSRDTRAALRRGAVGLVLLAEDGSARDRERLLRLAEEVKIPVHTLAVDSILLGEWVGRGKVAVVGVTDRNLAGEIHGLAASRRTEPGPLRGPTKRGRQVKR
jgi:ribosomal protein L7Ae-like RNA K-turn-binding protein